MAAKTFATYLSELTEATALGTGDRVPILESSTVKYVDGADIAPYLKYVALLTQSGTSAPTATVLENTLGGTVVWTRNDVGDYTGTLAGAFTANKTFMLAAVNGETSSSAAIIPSTIGVNSIGFYSTDSSNNAVELNGGCFFEIRVYP